MSLPTLVKSYQFNVNNAVTAAGNSAADNKNMLLRFKNALIGFGSTPWTVRYSCDGTTAGTAGDGVDRWSSTANIVMAASGSAHSWMVLRQTGVAAAFEMLIDCVNTSSQSASIKVSWNTAYAGGTTTAAPTASQAVTLFDGSATSFLSGTSSNWRWHAIMSTDGAITHFIATQAAGVQVFISINALTNLVSGWTSAPVVAGAFGGFNSNAGLIMNWDNNAGRMGGPSAWFGMPVATAIAGSICCVGNSAASAVALAPVNTNCQQANEIDGSWPMLPVHFMGATVNWRGLHGTFVDVYAGSQARPYGDTYPNDTSYQFAQFGGLIFPWNGVIPQL